MGFDRAATSGYVSLPIQGPCILKGSAAVIVSDGLPDVAHVYFQLFLKVARALVSLSHGHAALI